MQKTKGNRNKNPAISKSNRFTILRLVLDKFDLHRTPKMYMHIIYVYIC